MPLLVSTAVAIIFTALIQNQRLLREEQMQKQQKKKKKRKAKREQITQSVDTGTQGNGKVLP